MIPEKLQVVKEALCGFMAAESDKDVRRLVIREIKRWKPSTFSRRAVKPAKRG